MNTRERDLSQGDVSSPINLQVTPDGEVAMAGTLNQMFFAAEGGGGTAWPQQLFPLTPTFTDDTSDLAQVAIMLSAVFNCTAAGTVKWSCQLRSPDGNIVANYFSPTSTIAVGFLVPVAPLIVANVHPKVDLTDGNYTLDVFRTSGTATVLTTGCVYEGIAQITG